MSDNSAIEYLDISWNHTVGCDKKDSGCSDCYAIRTAYIRGFSPNPKIRAVYEGLVKKLPDGSLNWTGLVRPLPERLMQPIELWSPGRASGKPPVGKRIGSTFMGDTWHEDVPLDFIARAWAVMAHTPWHSYRVLTKRWQRQHDTLLDPSFRELVGWHYDEIGAQLGYCVSAEDDMEWPLNNVIVMASASQQSELEDACRYLLKTPAVLHALSLEPLLGPLDLFRVLPSYSVHPQRLVLPVESRDAMAELARAAIRHMGYYPLDWIITGGKSGGVATRRDQWLVEKCDHSVDSDREAWVPSVAAGAAKEGMWWGRVADFPGVNDSGPVPCCGGTGWRPKREALGWVRGLRDQAQALGIGFTFKQWGGPVHNSGGRTLDGRTHDADPGLPSPAKQCSECGATHHDPESDVCTGCLSAAGAVLGGVS